MATIKDIASKANVSVATVSYVLNNTRFVSADKKTKVLEAIEQLNYIPNAVARGLRVRESRTISLILPDITNPFYPDLAKACGDVAASRGYTISMINTNDEPGALAKASLQLRDGRVDGMIVATAMESDRTVLLELIQQGHPIVLAHRRLEGLPVDSIVSDNEVGGNIATRHLIKLGHRRIAFIIGVQGSSISISRSAGYIRAMQDAGLDIMPEWLIPGEAKFLPSYDAAVRLLSLEVSIRPTAVINLSDLGALATLDAAADLGISVPEELAVIGFDDLFFSGTRSVGLTTIRVFRDELGKQATERLLNRINGQRDEKHIELVLPVELVVRRTCGARISALKGNNG
jgi:LacI family transcriptional regulator